MDINKAEITIVRNLKEESWLSYFKNLIGDEDIITNNDTIIISFDDGTLSDTISNDDNKVFEMGPKRYYTNYPIYFDKKDKNLAFFKSPVLERVSGPRNLFSYMGLKLDCKPMFKDYPNYNTLKKEPSMYNAIYTSRGIDIFALVKIGTKFKYLLAYDDSYFDKSDLCYFINYVFINTNK